MLVLPSPKFQRYFFTVPSESVEDLASTLTFLLFTLLVKPATGAALPVAATLWTVVETMPSEFFTVSATS